MLNWGNRGMMAYFDALQNVAAPGADELDPLGYAHIYYMYIIIYYTDNRTVNCNPVAWAKRCHGNDSF